MQVSKATSITAGADKTRRAIFIIFKEHYLIRKKILKVSPYCQRKPSTATFLTVNFIRFLSPNTPKRTSLFIRVTIQGGNRQIRPQTENPSALIIVVRAVAILFSAVISFLRFIYKDISYQKSGGEFFTFCYSEQSTHHQ
jgi:hypothetical protein